MHLVRGMQPAAPLSPMRLQVLNETAEEVSALVDDVAALLPEGATAAGEHPRTCAAASPQGRRGARQRRQLHCSRTSEAVVRPHRLPAKDLKGAFHTA